MGALKEENNEPIKEFKLEKKIVQIPGFTEGLRKVELERQIKKLEKDCWIFQEYTDNGFSKSTASFQREFDPNNKKKNLSVKQVIAGLFFSIMVIYMASGGKSSTPDTPDTTKFFNSKLNDATNLSSDVKKVGLETYLNQNKISLINFSDFYNCISQKIYEKDGSLLVNTLADWCKKEFISNGNKFTTKYINLDNLKHQFSAWDGSHHNLENIIKKSMNDEDSYKHIQTTYRLVLDNKTPHMVVKTEFSGKNAFGARVKNSVRANVDLQTGNVLEIIK